MLPIGFRNKCNNNSCTYPGSPYTHVRTRLDRHTLYNIINSVVIRFLNYPTIDNGLSVVLYHMRNNNSDSHFLQDCPFCIVLSFCTRSSTTQILYCYFENGTLEMHVSFDIVFFFLGKYKLQTTRIQRDF